MEGQVGFGPANGFRFEAALAANPGRGDQADFVVVPKGRDRHSGLGRDGTDGQLLAARSENTLGSTIVNRS